MILSGDHYALLGVLPGDDRRTIGLAYRALARRFHPDVCRDFDAGLRMRKINAAYAVLRDPQRRTEYDRIRVPRPSTGDQWAAARQSWKQAARAPTEDQFTVPHMRVRPGAVDFGYIGRNEIASRRLVVSSRTLAPIEAHVLTRGDWLQVEVDRSRGVEITLSVVADPRGLHGFWNGPGPDVGRVDGWFEVVVANTSIRVPAGAILRRDSPAARWWNPFARRVG